MMTIDFIHSPLSVLGESYWRPERMLQLWRVSPTRAQKTVYLGAVEFALGTPANPPLPLSSCSILFQLDSTSTKCR